MISKETENVQSSEEIENAFRAITNGERPYVTKEELYAVRYNLLIFFLSGFSDVFRWPLFISCRTSRKRWRTIASRAWILTSTRKQENPCWERWTTWTLPVPSSRISGLLLSYFLWINHRRFLLASFFFAFILYLALFKTFRYLAACILPSFLFNCLHLGNCLGFLDLTVGFMLVPFSFHFFSSHASWHQK